MIVPSDESWSWGVEWGVEVGVGGLESGGWGRGLESGDWGRGWSRGG